MGMGFFGELFESDKRKSGSSRFQAEAERLREQIDATKQRAKEMESDGDAKVPSDDDYIVK